MDELDEKIVSRLRRDGRASFTDIASGLGVSEGTVRNRVEKMREEGVIKRFTVDTSGAGMTAVVMVSVATDRSMDSMVADLPGDVEAHEVTGDFDLVVKVSRSSTEALNEAIDSIRSIEGVESTRTYSVLKSHRR